MMKNLIKPHNEAEALALQAFLEKNGIVAQITSFRDTAYNGIFQTQYGWGVIKVDESDYERASKLITEWKNSLFEYPENYED